MNLLTVENYCLRVLLLHPFQNYVNVLFHAIDGDPHALVLIEVDIHLFRGWIQIADCRNISLEKKKTRRWWCVNITSP